MDVNKSTSRRLPKGDKMGKVEKKRAARQKMYKTNIGNKQEGQGFANRRKEKMMHSYKKLLRKEKGTLEQHANKMKHIYNEAEMEDTKEAGKGKKHKMLTPFHKAQLESKQREKEAEKKKLEFIHIQKERDEALLQYKTKKKHKHKKLAKKNFRGQPNMASQMELLLEQIQSTKS